MVTTRKSIYLNIAFTSIQPQQAVLWCGQQRASEEHLEHTSELQLPCDSGETVYYNTGIKYIEKLQTGDVIMANKLQQDFNLPLSPARDIFLVFREKKLVKYHQIKLHIASINRMFTV